MTDPLTIRQAQQGDAAAYEALVRRYQTVAFRTAWIILRDVADAEDVAQSAFLKAWLGIRRADLDRPFQPWLLAIVANEARNRRRARGRWLARVVPEDRSERLPETGPPLQNQVEQHEDIEVVMQHLLTMDDVDRTTLWCRYVLDLSEQETADVMDCAAGTVKSRTHRAMSRLRTRLYNAGFRLDEVEGGDRDV